MQKKNAIQNDGEIGGQQQTKASFFAHIDSLGRNQTKLPIKIALMIMFLWVKDILLTKTRRLLGSLIGNCDEVLVDWRNYCREACLNSLREPNLPKMGGTNQIVQIDESLMRGRRKYNRGRMLQGNRVPPSRQNYGRTVVGPWVFGLVWVRPDGKKDLRMFHVVRRDEATLRPIIQQNVAPETIIMSDEWLAYRNIPNWPNFNYIHRTVNHSENFVNPIDGTNTQRIESNWGWIKTKLVKMMRGTKENLLSGHLAEHWWRGISSDNPFFALIAELQRQFLIGNQPILAQRPIYGSSKFDNL